jgi:hypothetical protein
VWHGHTAGEFQDSWTNHSAMVIACFLVSRRVPKIFGRGLVDSVLLRCGFALICCKARGANALSLSPQCQIGILHCQRAARKISKGHSLLIFFSATLECRLVWSKHARMRPRYAAVGHAADMITCSFLFDLKNINKYNISSYYWCLHI